MKESKVFRAGLFRVCLCVFVLCPALAATSPLQAAAVTEESREWTPEDIQAAYSIPKYGGSDQTIAIIAQGDHPFAEKDLEVFRSKYKMTPCTEKNKCFRKRDAFGQTTNFPAPNEKSAAETSTDLEMASVACEECKLLLVEAEEKYDMLESVGEAVNEAVALGATEVSISMGVEEWGGLSMYNKYFNHPGIPITAGAGDSGYRSFLATSDGDPYYPASAPGVIAVGATELRKTKKTPRGWTDNVWPKTGGGCSYKMPKPNWQAFTADCDQRITSDISIVGYNVKIYATYYDKGGWGNASGTSVGAPLIAGIYAHASEKVRNEPVEAIYSNLYDGFGSIFDVGPSKKNNNTNYQGHSCSPLYLCNAVAGTDGNPMSGYDGPTGVGVPQGVPALPKWVIANGRKNVQMELFRAYQMDLDCASPTMCVAVGRDSSLEAPIAAE
jgi:subtilase family serine protease